MTNHISFILAYEMKTIYNSLCTATAVILQITLFFNQEGLLK